MSGKHGSEEGGAGKRRPLSDNQVHWVRDLTLREDASKVRATSRPANLAALRNAQLGVIRQHGSNDIAATRREVRYDNDLLHALLRLETAT